MTTIVVHGTLAYGGSWYQESWRGRGFLAGLREGMIGASGWHDIWHVNGKPVWSQPGLGRVFEWNGLPEGVYRGAAAADLASYLNAVAKLTDEPIRIVAHSHGCNVVKLASSLRALSRDVAIAQAVFLACPHFYEDRYVQDDLSWQDRLDIGKVSKAYHKDGHRFRYRLDPRRFGRILNVYCERDQVQVDLAQSLSGGRVPLTGSFLENVLQQFSTGTHETPQAARREMDEAARGVYEDLEVAVARGCSGIKTHSVMHGSLIGALAGLWLNSGMSIRDVIAEYGEPPVLPCEDTGE